ncbi:MAG: hypothetical protein FD153_1218 [Rhodospirillaceae bacterium]|nr:MAG: hypothetical protein FD153_1218 [Rhodospirillaceae bacterium]
MTRPIKRTTMLAAAVGLMTLAGCEYTEAVYPEKIHKNEPPIFRAPGEEIKHETIFGPEGLTLFGGRSRQEQDGAGGIGVNSFLWRAALDTIVFMPMNSVDVFGGVIITDWYAPSESPHERFKVDIYIFSRELRSDGLKVAAFRQIRQPDGEWRDAPLHVNTELENAILTRARQLRMASTKKRDR